MPVKTVIKSSDLLIEKLPVGLIVTDIDGRILFANPMMSQIVRYSVEELIGAKPNLWKSGNHTRGFYKELWEKILSGKVWEGTIQNKRKDGEVYWAWLHIAPLFDGSGNLYGFMSVQRDISQEVIQQQQLLDYYEQLYMSAIDNLGIGVGFLGCDRSLVYLNKQARRLLGGSQLSMEEYMQNLIEIPFVMCCLDKTYRTNQPYEMVIELNGGYFRFSTFPMDSKNNKLGKSLIFALIDITKEKTIEKELEMYKEYLEQEVENRTYALSLAKKRLEEKTLELRQAHENLKVLFEEVKAKNEELQQLDQLKTEFVFTVSHELRTPLTTIREGVALVLDKVLGGITDEQQETLEMVLSDIDRLTRIVNDFLDISKIESGKLELEKDYVDVGQFVSELLKSFAPVAEAKGLSLLKEIGVNKRLYCDKDRVSQVLVNLISNAIKFTDEGYIKVIAEELPEGVVFCVEDTGVGIPEDELPNIFDKFHQVGRSNRAGEQGTGLGLAISKGLVELHGGRMWVESTEGQGSRFCFTIPWG